MTNVNPEDIHQTVREVYGKRAKEFSDDGCCGTKKSCECSASSRNYPAEQLGDLPADLADISLGCGNPISSIDMRQGETVLDLGSGGGLDCFLAAKRVGPGGRVIGVDMTPEMIEKARANTVKLDAKNVEFRSGQIEDIPAGAGEVDVVISNCVINLSPDKPKVFREMYRILRPGGRVAVSDIVTNGPMSPLVARSLESWAGCVAGALDVKDYRQGLLDAGFTDVNVTPTDGIPFSKISKSVSGLPFSALITARKA